MRDNDAPKGPAPVSLRLTPDAAAALDALVAATGGKVPRHRLAVAALTHGARALAARPAELLPLLDVGGLLGALGVAVVPAAAVVQPATPVAPTATAVAPSTTPAPRGKSPAPRTRSAPARGDATPAEVDGMLRALRAAAGRGASINAIASAAGMNSGGTRKRLASLLKGERPSVSAELARAITEAAEAHGR